MHPKILLFLLALCALFAASTAQADFILRGFDPAIPTDQQIPALRFDNIRGPNITTCEAIRTDVPAVVSIQGNVARVSLFMSRFNIFSPPCQDPIFSILNSRWPFATTLPSGTYDVQFYLDPTAYGFTGSVFFLGSLPLTVTGSSNIAIPTLTGIGITLLLIVLALTAAMALSHRQRAVRVLALMCFLPCISMAQQTNSIPEVLVELKTGTDVNALVSGVLQGTPQANAFLVDRPKISRMPGPILNVDQERQLANLPEHPFAKIRRTLVLSYPRGTNLALAAQRLRLDSRVQSVQADDTGGTNFSAALANASAFRLPSIASAAIGTQYGLDALKLLPAYQYQDGWATGGIIDSGIDSTHPEFSAFSGFNSATQKDSGTYLGTSGGNLLRALSGDEALQPGTSSGTPETFGRNVDERRCYKDSTVDFLCADWCRTGNTLDPNKCQDMDSSCKSQFGNHGLQITAYGHGTHTSGLFAAAWTARTSTADKALGSCPGCGLAMRKISTPLCQRDAGTGVDNVTSAVGSTAVAGGLWSSINAGASVISMSFGASAKLSNDGVTAAAARGILLVGAAGNDKDFLQYPASRVDVVPATGFMQPWQAGYQNSACAFGATQCVSSCTGLECLWTNPKNYYLNGNECSVNTGLQCGSGAQAAFQRSTELTTAAKRVMSTFYRASNPAYPACWSRLSPTNCAVETCQAGAECLALCGNSFSCPSACSDTSDGVNDGYGLCTGTSMSAPQLAGVFALMLSANPLLTVESGVPNFADATIDGVRDLLTTTARASDANSTPIVGNWAQWYSGQGAVGLRTLSSTWGAGIPQADVAMQKVMGTIAGATSKHRLTPLFVLRQLTEPGYASPNEFAYTTAPPAASSFLNPSNGIAAYSSVGEPVRGFTNFRLGTLVGAPPAGQDVTPRAEVFILANNYRDGATPSAAQANAPALPPLPAGVNANDWQVEPLFSLVKCRNQRIAGVDRSKAAAEQCVTPPNAGTAYPFNRSPGFESLLALERELNSLVVAGYELRGKVGFVLACKPNLTCSAIPAATPPLQTYVQVVRACKGTASDLATFDCAFTPLSYVGAAPYVGYLTSTQPSGLAAMPLTYAWANAHTDSDDLIDGQELIAGTNELAADSDCDGSSDSAEYPPAGISNSDPMSNNNCADLRLSKPGLYQYRLANPVGPSAALAVKMEFSYLIVTVSPPLLTPAIPIGPSGWSCPLTSTVFQGANTFLYVYTCENGLPFSKGQIADFTVPKTSFTAAPFQVQVLSSSSDPVPGNNLVN